MRDSSENSPAIFIRGGEPWLMRYCWSTPKCRNLGVQYAFLEGKKAEETSPRKSTLRTLRQVDQQYPPGYCWPTPKYRNWCTQHAFFEGKKAEQTSSRKSTPRTLKRVDQQYPGVLCAPNRSMVSTRRGTRGHWRWSASAVCWVSRHSTSRNHVWRERANPSSPGKSDAAFTFI
jgi:hypothetical protein